MDYSTLVADANTTGSIQYWINYTRIDSVGILTEAQAWIYRKLRHLKMVRPADVAITSGASTAAFPTGYLDPIHLGIPGVVETIRLKDHEWFRANMGWDDSATLPEGAPTFWANINSTIHFNTRADQAYTAKLLYFGAPEALSGSNETNWLTEKYPTLLRRVCTMFAAEARKEYDMMDRSEARAMQMIEEINIESELGLRGLELDFHWENN